MIEQLIARARPVPSRLQEDCEVLILAAVLILVAVLS